MSWLMPVTIMILAVGLIILISGSWKTWTGDRAEQTTDDAYVRADLTPLSTKIAALVASVEVADYQAVKAGDVLVRLRDEVFALRLSRPKPLWRRVKPLW